MYKKISDVTVLTIIISTVLLVCLGSLIVYFLFAYQKKSHRHQEELILLNENFGKTLLLSRLEIQEQTLNHIAKELHSNISQVVSVININLSSHLQENATYNNSNITESKILLKQLMLEIRDLTSSLNTEYVGKAGYLKMIENEVRRLERTGAYKMLYSIEGEPFRLPIEKEIILFRLSQEIINNTIKHAMAASISIKVMFSESFLMVVIGDDGSGFNLGEAMARSVETNSTGLSNIINRSKQIDGNVAIDTAIGKGTTITVTIPI